MSQKRRAGSLYRLEIVLLLLGFLFLAGAAVLLYRSPAGDYEPSIYAVTPDAWILLLLSMGTGVVGLLADVLEKTTERRRLWPIAIALVLSTKVIAILSGWIRGYYFVDRTDNLTQWGFVQYIVAAGGTSSNNIYPLSHILTAQLALIANEPTRTVMAVLPIAVALIAVLGTYLLARRLLKDQRSVAIATLLAALILTGGGGPTLHPNNISILLVPLFLFIYLSSRRSFRYGILLTIFLVAHPFIHPLTTAVMIGFLFLGEVLTSRFDRGNLRLTPVLIMLITFVSWFSTTIIFGHSIQTTLAILSGDIGSSQLTPYLQGAARISVTPSDLVRVLMVSYGDLALLFSLSLLAIAMLRRDREKQKSLALVVSIVAFTTFVIAVLFLVNLGFDPMRFALLLMVGAIVLAAVALRRFVKMPHRSNRALLALVLVSLLVVSAGAVSILKTYPSPTIIRPNVQVTNSEVTGYFWAFEHGERSKTMYQLISPLNRFGDIYPGFLSHIGSQHVAYLPIPDHLGYNSTCARVSDCLRPGYIVLTTMDVETYTGVWSSTGRYSTTDFQRLRLDSTANLVYFNGGFSLYSTRI